MQAFPSESNKKSIRSLPDDDSNHVTVDQHKTILVVEDSEDVRHLAESILNSLGYNVITAVNGEDALRALESNPKIDLLFTDLLMPGGMDGLMLADQMRRAIPELPVVLTTGYMDEFANQDKVFPSLEVLPKPYRRADLEEKIRLAFSRIQGSMQ